MKISFIFIAVVLLNIISQNYTCARGSSHGKCIEVPIYFATTRRLTKGKNDFGSQRNFDRATQNVEYGQAKVVIKGQSILDSSNKLELEKLGCHNVSKKNNAAKIEISNRDYMYTSLREVLNRVASKEICIFVHGYKTRFKDALQAAALLESALKEPVVLFSWPSQGRLCAYTVDECNAEWSLRPFQVFMQGIENEFGPGSIMTVSHSMGNRLLNWYLPLRYGKGKSNLDKFNEIVLTSPDIDRATFRNYFYKVTDSAKKTRVYVSSKDIPLRLSKIVHGAYRAGSAQAFNDARWEFPVGMEDTETINFTKIDSGLLGHSIQFGVIAEMHRSGLPGLGMKLVQSKTIKGEYFTVEHKKKY